MPKGEFWLCLVTIKIKFRTRQNKMSEPWASFNPKPEQDKPRCLNGELSMRKVCFGSIN